LGQIRPETEADRTRAALADEGLTLPLAHGSVQIDVAAGVAATAGGQRLVTLLINILARMKGVVSGIYLVSGDAVVLPGTPLPTGRLADGLTALVAALNSADSEFLASLHAGPAPDPDVRVQIGGRPGAADIVAAADAWRALFGAFGADADWGCSCPIGSALAAVIAAVEVFKRLVAVNDDGAHGQLAPADYAYSAVNYRTGTDAASGPDVPVLRLASPAIVGCGAGGSGAAYVTAMHPRLSGSMALIEPGVHKLSNLNRYLATSADDVRRPRHKLSTLVEHLARFAPSLALELHARPWEQLDSHPWDTMISAVDTVESRWAIQRRAVAGAAIIDLAVDDLLYAALRVTPGGWCLFCKHPYDPDLAIKQRALRWGVPLDTVRDWTAADKAVDLQMLETLGRTQGQPAAAFGELLGVPFTDTPRLIECGSTTLQADVPGQTPILPLATSAAAVIGASELIKQATGRPGLDNWLAHDMRRNPEGPWRKRREPLRGCPHHGHTTP
jgi:molybdopterin/thiamine biosynthesis adenylyltransferase